MSEIQRFCGSSSSTVNFGPSVLARPSEEQGEISALRLYYRSKKYLKFTEPSSELEEFCIGSGKKFPLNQKSRKNLLSIIFIGSIWNRNYATSDYFAAGTYAFGIQFSGILLRTRKIRRADSFCHVPQIQNRDQYCSS